MIFALSIASLLAASQSTPAPNPSSYRDMAREIFAKNPCGDHSIVSDRAKAGLLDRGCREVDIETTEKVVRSLDGKREARVALTRADYRLGAVWPDFPPRPGNMPWETPGVQCSKVRVTDVAVFAGSSDTASSLRRAYEDSIWTFLTDYNTVIIADGKFPKRLLCSAKLAKGS